MATLVQSVGAAVSSANSVSAVFGANVTAGNLIFVVLVDYSPIFGFGSPTISDTLGNAYTLIQDLNFAGEQDVRCYYAKNILGGACTVTFTDTIGSPTDHAITLVCAEYSGLSTTAPSVSENQFNFNTGGGGTFDITLTDSNGFTWTVQYVALGGDPSFGVVDLTGFGIDLLLYYDARNGSSSVSQLPTTISPISGTFSPVLVEGGTGVGAPLRLFQSAGVIAFPC